MEKTITTFNRNGSISNVSNRNCWHTAANNLNKESGGVLIKYKVGTNTLVAMIRTTRERIVASIFCNGKSVRIYPDVSLEAALSYTRADLASLVTLVQ